MKLVLRLFCKVPLIPSPLAVYLDKTKGRDLALELVKKKQERHIGYKYQVSQLQDLEISSMFRMRELKNDKILSILKAYSTFNQGSEKLYKAIIVQLNRRINSFSLDELADIVYSLYKIPETDQIFEAIYNIVMENPLDIPVEIIGRLCFAYSIHDYNYKKFDSQLFRALYNIFAISKDHVSGSNGILLLTGLNKINFNDPGLASHTQDWVDKHWTGFSHSEKAQVTHICFHYSLIPFIQQKIDQTSIVDFKGEHIERILRCFVEKKVDPPAKLLDKLLELICAYKIDSTEVIPIVYTLSQIPNTLDHFKELYEFVVKHVNLMESSEKLYIFIAFLDTHKETQQLLEVFSREFDQDYDENELIAVFTAFLRRNSLFLPHTQDLLDNIWSKIDGKVLKTQELIAIAYILSKLNYSDVNFWRSLLKSVTQTSIKSAEEYIQLKKTLKELPSLGIDISSTIEYLESKYESK
jgi:hypothetical protein